jgi:hypothetical protein
MKTFMAEQPPIPIGSDDVQQVLTSIFKSKHFINAHKKKKFLRLICDFYLEGRAQELNEHILGYDVFGRDKSYNPSDDPIVRVFAYEIRKKLDVYYSQEGANDPIRLDIPAGSYQPVFTRHLLKPASESTQEEPSIAPNNVVDTATRRMPFLLPVILLAVLVLVIAVIVLALTNKSLKQEKAVTENVVDAAAFGAVWMPFLGDNNPPLVVLSNPPTLRFTNPSDPEALIKDSIPVAPEIAKALKDKFVMNPEVSLRYTEGSKDERKASSKDGIIVERKKTPSLILSTNGYTGIGEAIGLHYLTNFFRDANRNILLKQSRTLSAEDLKKHNVILLGGAWVNEWSGKLTRSEDFIFTAKGTIENRNPLPGEEREYIPEFDGRTGNLKVDYALITIKPNISEGNEVMLLAGVYSEGTEAAVEFVTSKNYLEQFNQRLQPILKSGSSLNFYQALLMVRVEDGIPTTISLLALHEVRLP